MGESMYRSTFSWPRYYLEVSGELHAPAALPRGIAPGTHWLGGCVNPRAGLDDVKKRKFLALPGLELRPLGRPASSYTDYAIPAPWNWNVRKYNLMSYLTWVRLLVFRRKERATVVRPRGWITTLTMAGTNSHDSRTIKPTEVGLGQWRYFPSRRTNKWDPNDAKLGCIDDSRQGVHTQLELINAFVRSLLSITPLRACGCWFAYRCISHPPAVVLKPGRIWLYCAIDMSRWLVD
jgi:hypothetical protein